MKSLRNLCERKMRYNRLNLKGLKINNWEFLNFKFIKNKIPFWLCRCICGIEKTVNSSSILQEKSKSCGCIKYKTQLNHNAFNTITEESAYWIGFLMADGCVCNNNRHLLYLALSSDDHSHLLKFKDFLKTNKEIKSYIKKTIKNKIRYISKLSINSNLILRDLNNYGITSNKVYTAKVCDSLKFNRDFWRGVIDGDGTLGFYNRKHNNIKTYQIGLTGSLTLLSQFIDFLKEMKIETNQKIHKIKQSNAYCLSFSNKLAEKIILLLYSNSSIFLYRKKLIADSIGFKK